MDNHLIDSYNTTFSPRKGLKKMQTEKINYSLKGDAPKMLNKKLQQMTIISPSTYRKSTNKHSNSLCWPTTVFHIKV